MRIEAFNHTISIKVFIKNSVLSLLRIVVYFWKPHSTVPAAWRQLKNNVEYLVFFRCDKRHNQIAVEYSGDRSRSLKDIAAEYAKQKPVFIKCDIEGWEYRILNDLIAYESQISGMVIEFHDVDLHRTKIENFIEIFSLELVHIHPNNHSGIDENGDPLVLELTFARNPTAVGNDCDLPHTDDDPNNPHAKDMFLNFEGQG